MQNIRKSLSRNDRLAVGRADLTGGSNANVPRPIDGPAKRIRCAIYTRKSSEEGLNQEFNSLDAQRAAGEACIASRKMDGWVCLPERYDDGGYSGANTDRPALKRLMADVRDGRIDMVIIYKLDRLSRSLRDFVGLVEGFDRCKVSMVAVTQGVNTGDSMGRLIFNVLISFAEFERELASDRTRDKIKASRVKGMWTGSRPVLGYDCGGSKLMINNEEAATVRRIFDLYLELRSLDKVLKALDAEGIPNKQWMTKKGEVIGGQPFQKTGLARMLGNVLYIGKVPHGKMIYDGQHTPIITTEQFHRVQLLLSENARSGASLQKNRHGAVLKGILTCAKCRSPMIHSTSGRPTTKASGQAATVTYRYYICKTTQLSGRKKCGGGSVPADQVERYVIDKIKGSLCNPAVVSAVLDLRRGSIEREIRDLSSRRELLARGIGPTDTAPADVAAANARTATERAITELDGQIRGLTETLPTREATAAGLGDFNMLWANLCPTERSNLIALLVCEVRWDDAAEEITIVRNDDAANETADDSAVKTSESGATA